MARTLQFRRGTSEALDAITGAEGEIFVDLDTNTIRVHDGSTQGGIKLATESYVDSSVFDGDYNSLTNSPSIPADVGDLTDSGSLLFDGDYNSLTNKPDLTAFDNVESFANFGAFPATGEDNKVYIANDTGFIYRWSGSAYVQLTDQTAIWGQIGGTLANQTDLQNALNAKLESSDIADFETTTELNARDTANRDRTNHTGSQAISTVTNLQSSLDAKQDNLVSGTNIKTINNESILGTGNITIEGGEGGGIALTDLSVSVAAVGTSNLAYNNTTGVFTFTPPDLSGLQDNLVSGTNIKTVDGQSIVGSGGITINNKTITLSGDVSGSGTTSINVQLGANVVGANELDVVGNGTSGQILTSVGDGTFTWSSPSAASAFPLEDLTNVVITSPEEGNALVYDGTKWVNGEGAGGTADLSEIAEDVLPLFDGVFDLGSLDKRWFDVFVENSVDIAGATITGSEAGVVLPSALIDDLLISENMITPDDSTARQYLGDKGVLVVDGNIDAQGDWIRVPVVETAEVDLGFSDGVWSSGGNLITARRDPAGAGTQTAALAFGGLDGSFQRLASTEEYDGTSWTSGGNLITARGSHAGAGTQDAALAFGGSPGTLSSTEEYDGTSWTSGGNLITARNQHAGAGTQDAALAFGGSPGTLSSTEEYDGTSWTSGGNLIAAREQHAGAGTQDAALAFGGFSFLTFSSFRSTEEYDGTTWTSGGSLIATRNNHAGAGTQTAALAFAGNDPSFQPIASTEEYNKSPIIETVTPPEFGEEGMIRYNKDIGDYEKYKNDAWIKWGSAEVVETVFGDGVWTSGGNLITARGSHAGAGTQTAALAFGGNFPPLASTEEYDGTSWSSGGNLITARSNPAGAGTQTAALAFGGVDGSFQTITSTEEYDGTTWTSGGNLITARSQHAGAGTQTAALAFGGSDSSDQRLASTEEYDGTSWTSGGNLITARGSHAGAGTQTAALAFGGFDSSFQTLASTEEYDGTSWTSGGNLIAARNQHAGAGTQSAALAFGGFKPNRTLASTEEYDGTSWTSGGNLIAAREQHAGAGTQTAALAFGGYPGPTASTEEYNKQLISFVPEEGSVGELRFNKDTGKFEGYNGTEWVALSGGGSVSGDDNEEGGGPPESVVVDFNVVFGPYEMSPFIGQFANNVSEFFFGLSANIADTTGFPVSYQTLVDNSATFVRFKQGNNTATAEVTNSYTAVIESSTELFIDTDLVNYQGDAIDADLPFTLSFGTPI